MDSLGQATWRFVVGSKMVMGLLVLLAHVSPHAVEAQTLSERGQEAVVAAEQESWQRFEASHRGMGVEFRIVGYAKEESTARAAVQAAFARIDELNQVFSDYDPKSEASRLSAGAGQGEKVMVSDDMFHVLQIAQRIHCQSDGAFDVTIGPISQLWRKARREKQLPEGKEIESRLQGVGSGLIELDADSSTVRLTRKAMGLDFGGIAKGYAADQALKELEARGIKSALVDASGDITLGDPPPDGSPWQAAVAPLSPQGPASRTLNLKNAAVATSGDAFQFLELGGKRYSHIIDPRTGWALQGRMSVSVIAPDGTLADAWASALSVLGPEAGLPLVESLEGIEALYLVQTSAGVKQLESSGFAKFQQAESEPDR